MLLTSYPPGADLGPSACVHAKLLQSYPTLCTPMDGSLPGSSMHGILQTRILEWVAMPSFTASSRPQGLYRCLLWAPVLQADCLPLSYQGSPRPLIRGIISWNSHNNFQAKYYYPSLIEEETRAQREYITCPRSQSW